MSVERGNTDLAVKDLQYDFVMQYVAEGRALGRAEGVIAGRESGERLGRCAIVLRLLTRRFGRLPLAAWARVHAARIEELDAIGDRLLEAQSLDEALGPRPPLPSYHAMSQANRLAETGGDSGRTLSSS